MAEIAVDIRNVSKSYGQVPALQGVSLTVHAGEVMTLLGPSGCGKTTLLYLIAGFIPLDGVRRSRRPRPGPSGAG
ncbi:MAG TPA: ATP-binding cassette domain-containing protein [Alphaproteobacteria bacterium]|nr:ATP-binding cassette domain-containing protein [Alphaproteobacteria bacterium]